MAKSSRCSQSVALSSWTTHILYGWNFKSFCKIVHTDSWLNLISRACLRADRPGLRISACLTLDVFWRPYRLIETRWLLLYNTSCCPQTVNPPENRIVAGNGVPASKLEMNVKKPLHCCDRLTILHICIISKHAVLYRPLLHSYWNGIV